MIPSPWSRLADLWRGNTAATSIEYALIASGIAMTIIGAVRLVGSDLLTLFSSFSGKI